MTDYLDLNWIFAITVGEFVVIVAAAFLVGWFFAHLRNRPST